MLLNESINIICEIESVSVAFVHLPYSSSYKGVSWRLSCVTHGIRNAPTLPSFEEHNFFPFADKSLSPEKGARGENPWPRNHASRFKRACGRCGYITVINPALINDAEEREGEGCSESRTKSDRSTPAGRRREFKEPFFTPRGYPVSAKSST